MLKSHLCLLALMLPGAVFAGQQNKGLQAPPRPVVAVQDGAGNYVLGAGYRLPLQVLNTISTRTAVPGDQIFLTTLVPVAVNNRIIIPAGSHVTGIVARAVRPGRLKGRGELHMRFETLTLANGSTISLTGRPDSLLGPFGATVDGEEGKIQAAGGSGCENVMVAGGASTAGLAMARGGGAGLAMGIGAAASVAAILFARGPEAVVDNNTVIMMTLAKDVVVTEAHIATLSTPQSAEAWGTAGPPSTVPPRIKLPLPEKDPPN